jgi:hypothetical protein
MLESFLMEGESMEGTFDIVDRLIRWDEGDLEYDEFIETAQYLVDTTIMYNGRPVPMAFTLQGSIGRTCVDLIENGQIDPPTRSSIYSEGG